MLRLFAPFQSLCCPSFPVVSEAKPLNPTSLLQKTLQWRWRRTLVCCRGPPYLLLSRSLSKLLAPMWGARGVRLWRCLYRLHSPLSTPSPPPGTGSSLLAWTDVEASLLSPVAPHWVVSDAVSAREGFWKSAGISQLLKSLPAAHQRVGIMTKSESSQTSSDGGEQLVRSPLSQAPAPVDSSEGGPRTAIGVKKETQAVLTYIKQSPKKVNLVAMLVRGMRVDDALMQMAVSTKRAAKVVAKVITSARANAIHNFGLDKNRLIVSEAFVGKDRYLKRLRIHGKGKAGKMVRPRCRLTVIVKELSPEKEAELARLRVHKYYSRKIRGSFAKLMPHRVLATQWQWSRKPARKESLSLS